MLCGVLWGEILYIFIYNIYSTTGKPGQECSHSKSPADDLIPTIISIRVAIPGVTISIGVTVTVVRITIRIVIIIVVVIPEIRRKGIVPWICCS